MALLQEKKAFYAILHSPIVIIILLILSLLLLNEVYDLYQKRVQTKALRDDARAELAVKMAEKEQLERKAALLDTKEGLEAVIREKYAVSRPGEQVVVVRTEGGATTTEKEPNWFVRMFRKVFGE